MPVLTDPFHPRIEPPGERSAHRTRMALPRDVRKMGRLLLHQQCWFLGQDIKRTKGNLLLQYGFDRFSKPDDEPGSSAYKMRLPKRRVLILWGFGFYFGAAGLGGMIVGRYEFRPRLTPSANLRMPVWVSEKIPGRLLPQNDAEFSRALRLLAGGMRALSDYESWVAREIGLDYRRRLIVEWNRDFVPAEGIAETWLAMAQRCERRAEKISTSLSFLARSCGAS